MTRMGVSFQFHHPKDAHGPLDLHLERSNSSYYGDTILVLGGDSLICNGSPGMSKEFGKSVQRSELCGKTDGVSGYCSSRLLERI
jgi:hypothetical protein